MNRLTLCSSLIAACFCLPVAAATLVVDNTSDNPALQACTGSANDCSLRGALIRTQRDLPGEDTIAFDIPAPSDSRCVAATGVCTITLDTDSMDFSSIAPGVGSGPNQGITIDGYSQPGASVNTNPVGQGTNAQLKIKLVGPPGTNRLIRTQVPFTFRGLIFQDVRLHHERGDGATGPHLSDIRYELMGNFFGFDADGVTPYNFNSGASLVNTSGLTVTRGMRIGSGLPADMNLFGAGGPVGGRPQYCLNVIGGDHRIRGNFIGVDRTGLVAHGCQHGVRATPQQDPQPIEIGGAVAGEGNVIGGHVNNAVHLSHSDRSLRVNIRGNHIGVGVDGVTPIPSETRSDCAPRGVIFSGFRVPGSAQIGGLLPGEGNIFGPNGINRPRCPAPGVEPPPYIHTPAVGESPGVWQVQGNRYVGIEGMAVDLRVDGNTAPQRLVNDAGDADSIPGQFGTAFGNRMQNFPTISAFSLSGNQVNLTYKVDSTPANSLYPLNIEFLRDDGRGNLTPIGTDIYTAAEAQTDKSISFALPAGITLGASDIVIATATTTPNGAPGENVTGETSETTFHALESFSLVSITPTTTPSGVPVTVRVRAVAALGVPFRPNGRVLVQGRIGPGIAEECTALLAPVAAARTSEGECQLITTAPAGTIGVRMSYDGARNSFALADGRHPESLLQSLTVLDRVFSDGFE